MTRFIETIVSNGTCTGCGACVNRCPQECIKMQIDTEGFLYPTVDEQKCVDCGICEKTCPKQNPLKKHSIRYMVGGCYKDQNIVEQSSSGGAFYLFASQIIKSGGKVCAVVFNGYHVEHKLLDSLSDLPRAFGSKYVQSDIHDIYRQIENELKDNTPILFTGTPCQVEGLIRYLGKEYPQLYLLEFICHGVPSPGIWEDYIAEIEKEMGGTWVKTINFRSKSRYGWHDFELYLENEAHIHRTKRIREDLYYNGFIENLFLRRSCYQCSCKGEKRAADISIADFWGNEVFAPKLSQYDKSGLSLLTVFTDKGDRLFKSCKESFDFVRVDDIRAYTSNTASVKSAAENRNRERFFAYRQKVGTYAALEKYAAYTFNKKLYNKIKWYLQKKIGKI